MEGGEEEPSALTNEGGACSSLGGPPAAEALVPQLLGEVAILSSPLSPSLGTVLS